MRLNKFSVIVFLALLVVALVSVNFVLYSKLQFKDRFNEEKKFIKLKVRKRSLKIIIVKGRCQSVYERNQNIPPRYSPGHLTPLPSLRGI